MKLSFSLPSKQSSRPAVKPSQTFNNEDDDTRGLPHEYVTEFDSSKTPAHDAPKKFVIPPKQNAWRPEKRMRNLDLPLRHSSDDPELQFEVEAPSMAGGAADSAVSYGLNLRQNSKDDAQDDSQKFSGVADAAGPRPSASAVDGMLLQKLKHDLEILPEDRGFEEFNDVPVEGFGAALLAGYGWYEGRGIGRNAKADVKVYQISKRTAKEGLGFVADMPERKENNSAAVGSQRVADKASRLPRWLSVNKVVRIVSGRDVGLKGKVVDILDADSIVLKLSMREKEVTVRIHEVAELGSVEEENCLKKLKELEIGGSSEQRLRDEHRDSSSSHRHRERREKGGAGDNKKDNKRSREEGRRHREAKHSNGALYNSCSQNKERTSTPNSWLTSNIRVRIVSKDFRGGMLYLKKGEVVDVVGPKICDISMDESRELIQGVDQDILETALPRRGGRVLVLYGKHKGVLGNLLERDLNEDTGVVQDSDNHALLHVRLEQIAEYVGDPSYMDY